MATGIRQDVGNNGQTMSPAGAEFADTMNAVFLLLEDAYPLRFRRAFPDDETVARAKRVWSSALNKYTPRRIFMATRKALGASQFLPDLGDICKLCKLRYDEAGLKEPLQAYYEACHAPVQSRDYAWSHIAVYLAARTTGWTMLRSEEQRTVFPVFERNYEILSNRVLDGEDLEASILTGIEDGRRKEASRRAEEVACQQQRAAMVDQGIDPDNGVSARSRLKGILNI